MGFLSLYDQTDRVELGGGYYVDIKRFLSTAETERADRALVAPTIKSEVTAGDDGDSDVRAVTSVIDQNTYNLEIMVAAVFDWNLDDRAGAPLPLPPYMPAKPSGPDPANEGRRHSIRLLPDFAKERILKQISDNKKRGLDTEGAFPGAGEGGPSAA